MIREDQCTPNPENLITKSHKMTLRDLCVSPHSEFSIWVGQFSPTDLAALSQHHTAEMATELSGASCAAEAATERSRTSSSLQKYKKKSDLPAHAWWITPLPPPIPSPLTSLPPKIREPIDSWIFKTEIICSACASSQIVFRLGAWQTGSMSCSGTEGAYTYLDHLRGGECWTYQGLFQVRGDGFCLHVKNKYGAEADFCASPRIPGLLLSGALSAQPASAWSLHPDGHQDGATTDVCWQFTQGCSCDKGQVEKDDNSWMWGNVLHNCASLCRTEPLKCCPLWDMLWM